MLGQFEFAAATLAPLSTLLADERQLLITHGNGPQVGYILTRVEEALGKAYPCHWKSVSLNPKGRLVMCCSRPSIT